jgi:2-polyprenyl-6-methoxyphenol hydroxylase-like FAD-dependent oxidoreductase
VLLRDRFPDVLSSLEAAGGFPMPLAESLGEARPGDEDLTVLAVRRTTFEWVLRNAAFAEPGVEVVTGVGVDGLMVDAATGDRAGTPRVTGLRLEDGSAIDADVVVAATGRRGDVPAWLGAVGVEVAETVHESGLMYLSRWYRLPDGFSLPPEPRLGGDLGHVKYLAIPGDGETFSVTISVRTKDRELRATLSDPDRFDAACHLLEGPSHFFADHPIEPLTTVLPMGGLINRIRRFVDAEGNPLVHGFHAVGDAHTCTNPLYGRGCSLAAVQGVALADAFAEHGEDLDARARAYEAYCADQVEPWFDISVQADAMGSDPNGRRIREAGVVDEDSPQAMAQKAIGTIFERGARDPVLGRGILRLMNLLATPAELMADPEFMGRAMEVLADPERFPATPPVTGPSRDELLALDAERVA